MPPEVQSELAQDQFIRAIIPAELWVQVQLQHPQSLQRWPWRENVCGAAAGDYHMERPPPLPPEADDNVSMEPVVAVGRTGNSCYVSVTV